MKRLMGWVLAFVALVLVAACDDGEKWRQNAEMAEDAELLHRSTKALTDVIVHDIFSPPVASRIYAYPSIAAYEVMVHTGQGYQSMAGQLHELEPTPVPDSDKEYSLTLSALEAYLTVGQALIFSEEKIEEFRAQIYEEFHEMGIPEHIFQNSLEYGNQMADHILMWADKDNYKQTRTYPKYTITDEPESWKPTPPDYMEGIEPHWSQIRPFVIDSADQFIPGRPTEFNMDRNSTFFEELMEVYEVGLNLDSEQEEIAQFWDCNPYVSHHKGHVMYAVKKITPGGHWVGITTVACRVAESSFMESAEAYALTTVALADGFISCWDEKWRSILIRPETVINQYIDEDWLPLLQTPPFPEYTSGHSVVSGAASVALTSIFGDPFYFEDTVELEYGLPMRAFGSFYEASSEAAISRLYGGIHYMPAIENGLSQGKQIGNLIVDRLELREPSR